MHVSGPHVWMRGWCGEGWICMVLRLCLRPSLRPFCLPAAMIPWDVTVICVKNYTERRPPVLEQQPRTCQMVVLQPGGNAHREDVRTPSLPDAPPSTSSVPSKSLSGNVAGGRSESNFTQIQLQEDQQQ